MECKRIFIIAPPFYSHFSPMMALAVCFRRAGASVVVGCSASFSDRIKGAGLEFAELEITRNANTGVAEKTEQPAEEAERIRAFIEATKRGALETLRFQNRNRQLDMLADPERIREEINVLAGRFKPDFFVVDQLSYAVSLALYCLQLPFITFCPGHPTYIPQEDQLFGVPYAWPPEFDIADMELAELRNEASGVRDHFTAMFNAIIQEYDSRLPLIRDAFRFASESAQLFNYPDFGGLHKDRDGPKKIFLGYCFTEEGLNRSWQEMLAAAGERYPRVLVSFGTFLSAREDVLRKTVAGIVNRFPQSLCIVSAGASAPALRDLENDGTIVRDFLPQKPLLEHLDLFVHHGGNNSFTESLFYGVPMIIMPFSSDQFSIAHDARQAGLAACVNPNGFSEAELADKISLALGEEMRGSVSAWRKKVTGAGPRLAADTICGKN